jgi:hypothetical protein
MYNILPYTQRQAKKLGVMVQPSTNPKKKLDVFKEGQKVASVGDINYSDYSSYLKERGKVFADERKRLYHIRHKKDSSKKGTPGWFAKNLLW